LTELPALPGSAAVDVGAPPSGPSPTLRTLVRLFALAAIGATLFVFHGISFNLTPWSQAIINGIVKYVYPTAGQADTTVVLFREENLRDLNESYPVSYERHAEVLEALSTYKPRAVFIDFAFVDKRSPADVERLSQAICGLTQAGTSVYLAAPAGTAGSNGTSEVLPGLVTCAKLASAQIESPLGSSGVLTYSTGVRTPSGFRPTPAFAMAAPRLGLDPSEEQPMEIIWGNGVAPLNRKWMGCESDGAFAHLFSILRQQPMSVKLKCPYARTLTVGHLLGSSGDADVQDALEQRTVFYGAAFQLTGDRVTSPVYNELPGVYLHAMAYDNLVTFGRDYKRAQRELFSVARRRIVVPLSGLVDGVLLFATVAILLAVEEGPALTKRLGARLTTVSPRTRWGVVGLAAVLVIAAAVAPASLSSIFLSFPLVLAAVAAFHLVTPTERAPGATHRFLRHHALMIGMCATAVSLFLVVDRELGLEASLLLVALPGYFLYKVLVAKDVVFVATSLLLVLASLVSFVPPINLGPRNIVAYIAFFEVARHLIEQADRVAIHYFSLRRDHPHPKEWGLGARAVSALDWFFRLCQRGGEKEKGDANPAGSA
jgi:CHASE2 domain-containing sensor protein